MRRVLFLLGGSLFEKGYVDLEVLERLFDFVISALQQTLYNIAIALQILAPRFIPLVEQSKILLLFRGCRCRYQPRFIEIHVMHWLLMMKFSFDG